MPRLLIALSVLLTISGCSGDRVIEGPVMRAPAPAMATSVVSGSEYLAGFSENRFSLFKADQEVLSNDDLERILALKLTTPERARLAFLALGGEQAHWSWSPEVAKAEQGTIAAFSAALAGCKRLGSVQAVPALLLPRDPTIPRMRQSAARMQADLLVVYAPRFQTYEKYRVFGRDESKAYCTVEAVLLDVRSGIVRTTSVASEDFAVKRGDDDTNFAETVRKAQCEVLGRALLRVAHDMSAYLDQAP